MKAKSKVLLGLIVALAMMVFAVPALAATFTATTDPATAEVTAYTDQTSTTFKFDIQETDPKQGDVYTVAYTDTKTTATADLTFTNSDITLDESGKATVTVTATIPAETNEATPVGVHNVRYVVTKTNGSSTSVADAETQTCKITVVAAPKARLQINNSAITKKNKKISKNIGETTGLNVALNPQPEAGAKVEYVWQQADKEEEVNKADSTKWTPVDGQTTSRFTKALTEDMDGKFVRCVVSVDGHSFVAYNLYSQAANQVYCAELDVNNPEEITVKVDEVEGATTTPAQSKYEFFAGEQTTKSLKATASGGSGEAESYSYKWYKEGSDTPVSTTDTLTFAERLTAENAGEYKCVVTDGTAADAMTGESDPIEIVVKPTPTLKADKATVTTLAEYKVTGLPNIDNPTDGEGTVSVNKADIDKGLVLNAVTTEMEPKNTVWYKVQGATESIAATTKNLDLSKEDLTAALTPDNHITYKVVTTFDGITKPLNFTVDFKKTDGKLEGKILESYDAGATIKENDAYKITLPAGLNFKTTTNPAAGDKVDVQYLEENYGVTFLGVADTMDDDNIEFDNVKVTTATATAPATLTFRYKTIGVQTDAIVGPMEIMVDEVTATEGTAPAYVNLPVDETVGYKILLVPADADVALDNNGQAVPTLTKDYTGQPVEAKIWVTPGVGEATNIKYAKETATAGTYGTPTAEAPTEAGTYQVTCDVKEGTKYAAKTGMTAGTLTISPRAAVKEDFVINPDSKVYNGKEQTTEVKFAEGVKGAGEIDKVTFKDQNNQPINPKEVGKYKVFVTTKGEAADFTNINKVTTPLEVGTFEITKVPADAKNYTIDPAEVKADGTPREAVVKVADGAGEVTAKHYFKQGSEEELEGAPTEAGVYTVKVDTAANDNYDEGKMLEVGTFTLKPETPAQQDIYMIGHVQNIGWGEDEDKDNKGDGKAVKLEAGKTAQVGTTGLSLRVEAVTILVPADYTVEGFAHVQDLKDQDVKKLPSIPDYITNASEIPEGYVAYMFGTEGQSKRVEAVNIGIKDADGKYVEGFEYATHVQNQGWLGSVRNGSFSGSRGQSLRMEAIRFYYDDVVRKPIEIDEETKAENR